MIAIEGDVADPASIERLFTEVESRFGDCDVLVNNAGMTDVGAPASTPRPNAGTGCSR